MTSQTTMGKRSGWMVGCPMQFAFNFPIKKSPSARSTVTSMFPDLNQGCVKYLKDLLQGRCRDINVWLWLRCSM